MSIKKEITFFYTDGTEKQTYRTIMEEAENRGYETVQTSNIYKTAEIGFYCSHSHYCHPENARFSVVMLHDMAQGHNRWPNFWAAEPWNRFDIGILPGSSWFKRWKLCSHLPYTIPRRGVHVCGWPKSDLIFKNKERFEEKTAKLKKELGLVHEATILYAPSWENDNKQNDVVEAFKDLPVNVLLKQPPYQTDSKNGWTTCYPAMIDAIEKMNCLHRGCSPNVHIIDPEISIMYCIGIADVLVSDESSTMIEALLLDVPSIAVTDWLIPDTKPPRFPVVPFDFALKTKKEFLRKYVCDVLDNRNFHLQRLKDARDEHFANLGNTSVTIMNLIDLSIKDFKEENHIVNIPEFSLFVNNTVKMVESGKIEEAYSYYDMYRKYFPLPEELSKFDEIMKNLYKIITK